MPDPVDRTAHPSCKTKRPLALRSVAKGRVRMPSDCGSSPAPCLVRAGGAGTIGGTIAPTTGPGQGISKPWPAGRLGCGATPPSARRRPPAEGRSAPARPRSRNRAADGPRHPGAPGKLSGIRPARARNSALRRRLPGQRQLAARRGTVAQVEVDQRLVANARQWRAAIVAASFVLL